MGKQLVELESNAVTLTYPYLEWVWHYGSVLGALALFLGPRFRRVYIASLSEHNLPNYGSHPQLDPQWSTETVEIVHDGFDVRRVDKVGVVARSDVALDTLQVCLDPNRRAHNCGRCEKCIRTMVSLHLAGALDRCRTFPEPLDFNRVAEVRMGEGWERDFMRENLDLAMERGEDPRLIRAMEVCLQRRPVSSELNRVRVKWRHARRRLIDIPFQIVDLVRRRG
jgi:hypothetical protein